MTDIKSQMFKTKLIVGADKIAAATADIARVGKKLDTMIQVCGMSCLAHVDEHRDVAVLENLFAAMPKGSRKKALLDWILKYGKVLGNIDEKGKLDESKPFLFNRKGSTNLEGAEAEPWYDCAPDKLDVPMDFMKLLDALIKKGEKAQDGVGFVDPAHASVLKAITEARHSLKLEATAVEA